MPTTISDCMQLPKGRARNRCVKDVGKNERVEIRQSGRTDRNSNKWNAAGVAYNNGIDFSANRMGVWAQSAAGMTSSLSSAAASVLTPNPFGSMFGNGVFSKGEGGSDKKEGSFLDNLIQKLQENALMVALIGGAAFLLRKTL